MRISDWSSDVCSSDLIQYEHVYPPGTDAADLLVQMQLPFVVLRQVPRDVETEASPLADGLGCHERREHPLGAVFGNARAVVRSEEHTSELQSLMRISYAVFCLKKKKTTEL